MARAPTRRYADPAAPARDLRQNEDMRRDIWVCVALVAAAGCDVGRTAPQHDWAAERRRMVDEQLRPRGIRNARVLEAMLTVPRHLFVPDQQRDYAYGDTAL